MTILDRAVIRAAVTEAITHPDQVLDLYPRYRRNPPVLLVDRQIEAVTEHVVGTLRRQLAGEAGDTPGGQ